MIYVIAERDSKRADWLRHAGGLMVKVGYSGSESCNGRLGSLQTGNPRPLVVVAELEGSKNDEWEAHRWLAPFAERGEWFFIPRSIARVATFKPVHDLATWRARSRQHNLQALRDRRYADRVLPTVEIIAARLRHLERRQVAAEMQALGIRPAQWGG